MQIIHGIKNFSKKTPSPVVTIGNFDGLHLGHKKLLSTAIEKAKEIKGSSIVLTFKPHPRDFFQPEKPFQKINTYEEKGRLLEQEGLEYLIEQDFDLNFSQNSKEDFLKKTIMGQLNTKMLILGHDFAFGKDRKGNTDYLKEEVKKYNIKLHQVDPALSSKGKVISSSSVRKLITAGDIEEANIQLDRPFFITKTIVKGNSRGKSLTKYPTINMDLPDDIIIPKNGVYVTKTLVEGKIFDSITNIGIQPSFANSKPSLETHIFDFNKECYDTVARVYFFSFLREEKKFSDIEALKAQIEKDILTAKGYTYLKGLPIPLKTI